MTPDRFAELSRRFPSVRAMVVGDVMLDAYWWGDASRLSPEAPVPVVHIESVTSSLGGAGNVAMNLTGMGVRQVSLLTVTGEDDEGRRLAALAEQAGIDGGGILQDKGRTTTVKTRIIARGQQIVRGDRERESPLSGDVEERLIQKAESLMGSVDLVLMEDYNKGVMTARVISALIESARQHSVPTYVDPKERYFHSFRNAVAIKPNVFEAGNALGRSLVTDEEVADGALEIRRLLKCEAVLISRGERGLLLADALGVRAIPTRARRVHDVSGAGDTVISVFALSHASGADFREAAFLANAAGGRVCEEPGVVPITVEKLHDALFPPHSG